MSNTCLDNVPVRQGLVEFIPRVGHVTKIKIIAKWLEDEQMLIYLKEIGVDYAQGYYFGISDGLVEVKEL